LILKTKVKQLPLLVEFNPELVAAIYGRVSTIYQVRGRGKGEG
jgi:hypothetical protein